MRRLDVIEPRDDLAPRGSADYSVLRRLFFEPGGLPGPRRRRRRRPFFGGFFGERLPKRLAIALRTSASTSSRMTVMMLLRRGIPPPPCYRELALSKTAPVRKCQLRINLPPHQSVPSGCGGPVGGPTLQLSGEEGMMRHGEG